MVPAAAGLEGRYHGLRLPVSIMAGGDDRIVDPEHQSIRLHAMIEHSELRVLPGLGHMIHYFATDQVVRAIDSVSAQAESLSLAGG
jgi:pimeloyl-ACP methyl ester carboxylesterase